MAYKLHLKYLQLLRMYTIKKSTKWSPCSFGINISTKEVYTIYRFIMHDVFHNAPSMQHVNNCWRSLNITGNHPDAQCVSEHLNESKSMWPLSLYRDLGTLWGCLGFIFGTGTFLSVKILLDGWQKLDDIVFQIVFKWWPLKIFRVQCSDIFKNTFITKLYRIKFHDAV